MIDFVTKEHHITMPPGLNIYRLRAPDASDAGLRRVIARFGLTGTVDAGSLSMDVRSLSYFHPASGWNTRLLRHSGGWQYRHVSRWQADDRATHLVINDHDAAQVALKQLWQYALPSPPDLELTAVQRLHVAHCQSGGTNHQERVVGVRVFFHRVLDGLPAEGPGSRTVVYLDHQKELSGIDHLWRDIEAVHEPVSRLRPVDEAFEEVRRRYGTGRGRIEVLSVTLAYYELGWGEAQEFLQPAYVVKARVGDGKFRMNAIVPVAAAANAVGPIQPVRSAPRQQAARAGASARP